jgi:serine/threonine protein kinase
VVSRQLYSQSSDLWSAGVLLFILLSGRMPFFGETVRARLGAVSIITRTVYSKTQ